MMPASTDRWNRDEPDGPIVRSLLDLDYYKLTMGQWVFRRHRATAVTYAFVNRTETVRLADWIAEAPLRAELDHVRTLRLTAQESAYLRGLQSGGRRLFDEAYLTFLAGLRLPAYRLAMADGVLHLHFDGPWPEAIYWETIALAIVTELYGRALAARQPGLEREKLLTEGRRRLAAKIAVLRDRPDITFTDFGTRRRFSRSWQDEVDATLAEALPGRFLGTSSVASAQRLGIAPIGTMAHELFMGRAALADASDDGLRASSRQVLEDWWEDYGAALSIALTDTWGSEFFFRDMTPEQARRWKGLRQDSGDPFAFGERALHFYEACGVDAREKVIVFSNGLALETIVALADRFAGRIGVTFGWGTNLTNDLGLSPPSMVIKLAAAGGRPTVKLSDNLAKAMGPPELVERYRRVFGQIVPPAYQACRY